MTGTKTPVERQIQYIQLDQGDDVPLVRDRMSFLRGKRALIIWPERGTALTRKLDLVMVQREARRRAVQIAFVTHDAEVIKNARELGISTFETIREAERGRWKRGWGKVAAKRYQKPAQEPEPEQLKPLASRITNQNQRSRIRSFLERIIVLVVLFGVVGGVAYIVMPYATVTVALATQQVDIDVTIYADPTAQNIDVENRVIPATRLPATVQTAVSIPTTGTQQLGTTQAIGIVTFTNNTSERIIIPEGTIVQTSGDSPVEFETTGDANLSPGNGQTTNAGVTATDDFVGEIGNVEAGQINTIIGEFAQQVSVSNASATTNGDTQVFQVVTQSDQDNLLAQARAQLQNIAYQEMKRNLAPNQQIIVSTIRIAADGERSDWTNFSHNVGDATDSLTLRMQAIVEAISVDTVHAQQIVFTALSGAKPRGLVFDTNSITYEQPGSYTVDENGRIAFSMGGHAIAAGQFEPGQLQEQIAHQSVEDATRIIEAAPGIDSNTAPTFIIGPEWYGDRLPMLPIRITISTTTANTPNIEAVTPEMEIPATEIPATETPTEEASTTQ
ncbi:hypothetical protein G4Y79_14375 [Phototrophicus methaneseepsis]|uniref:Baseplate protein J-like domain-containing protein n=1 Tax=Phototrophicus methaneseepsis TaxID=2710758 RepID=A0A7S8ID14_9CHLR|nr:hypothetical protein [Phototrophicus methaneseepsis]QPC80894.1 hypothetical protein G4Y79_14375 [Phototrophicus methaneseepsis]